MPRYQIDPNGNAIITDEDEKIQKSEPSSKRKGWIVILIFALAIILFFVFRRPNPSNKTISVGTGTNSIVVLKGRTERVSFTPSISGTFIFTTTGSDDTYGYLYSSATNPNAFLSDDDSGSENNFKIEYPLLANQTVYIGLRFINADMEGDIYLNISRKINTTPTPSPVSQIESVYTGTNYISVRAGQTSRVKYTASSPGIYSFTSLGADDTYGFIYSSAESNTELESNDDGGINYNFLIERNLSRNETVYIGVKFLDQNRSGDIVLDIYKKAEETQNIISGTYQPWPVGSTCRVISSGTSNTRTGPGTNYEIAQQVYEANVFTILDVQMGNTGKDWYKVNVNGRICWISSGLVEVGGYRNGTNNSVPIIDSRDTTVRSWPVGSTCRVISPGTSNTRTGAGTNYDIAEQVYEGNAFTVLDVQMGNTRKDWYKINVNGRICWISSGLVEVGGYRNGTINSVPIN